MILRSQLEKVRGIYREFPRPFWTLITAVFIDRLGGALVYPFFSLYITRKFGVGMTEVGILFAMFSVTGIIGSTIGGALTDRLGRKRMLILGLIISSLSTMWIATVQTLELFYAGALVIGLVGNMGGPAGAAMVADLLPEEKRAQGYGILRVVFNLAVAIGPAIGGVLASVSYLLLFSADAVTSLITAVFVRFLLPETMPKKASDEKQESLAQSFRGYGKVAKDAVFMAFFGGCLLMWLVYMQMNSTLAVYLRDVHNVAEQGFGYIISLNALMVVLLQFGITRRLEGYPRMLMMALGMLLYAIGFSMYGFTSLYGMFMLAMVVITLGEMVIAPVAQAIVADMAPEDMRGRYMAFFGFTGSIAAATGPLLAGLIMDHGDPRWVWYIAGMLGVLTAAVFWVMHGWLSRRASRPELAREPVS